MKEFLGGRRLPFLGLVAFTLCSPISIAATNAAWVATLLFWLYRSFSEHRFSVALFPRTELNAALGVFLLASFLSVWSSVDFQSSLFEFRSLGLMVIYFLFFWNIENHRDRKQLVFCLLGAATVTAAFGVIQFTTGWDFTGHFDPATRKAGSFFGLHLTLGEYLVLTTCLIGGIILFGNPSVPLLSAGVAVSVLMMVGVVASGAKNSLLGLLTGGTVLLGLRGRRTLLTACGLGVIATALIVVLKSWPPLHAVVSQFVVDAGQTTGPMDSNTQRVYMWWSGFRISLGHLLNGVGMHAVDAVYPTFRHSLAREANQWHLHNQYVQIGVTRGLFGLTGFMYIFIAAFRAGYRRFRLCQDPWDRGIAGGILAGLAGFLVCGLTEYCWGDSEILMLVYMLLGLMVSIPVAARQEKPSNASNAQPSALETGPLRAIGRIVSLLALAAILLISLQLPPVQPFLRTRILQFGLGAILLYSLSGPILRNPVRNPEFRRVISCIVVFAAYAFTRHLWISAEAVYERGLPSAAPEIAVLLPAAVLCSLVGWGLWRKSRLTPFDTSVFTACILWVVSALGTNVLLALATRSQTIMAPPLIFLLPLVTGVLALYSVIRFSYEGGRGERLFLACIALSMFIHAFR